MRQQFEDGYNPVRFLAERRPTGNLLKVVGARVRTVDSESNKQAKELVRAALQLDLARRSSFLADACAGNPELRRDVEKILAYQETGDLPDDALIEEEPAGSDPLEGRRFGPYRAIREIGRGGMGAVYLGARDDDEFKKSVAIKLLKRGTEMDDVIARFRTERQILASVDHPNIGRLIDGGATEDGLPYFIMEYIEGQSIDQYCDSHRLSTTERLKLFRKVCGAVHFAHQNIIVHRDLKPKNILVTAQGEPKLLDFGIAKLLNPDMAAVSLQATVAGVLLMTPQYASPEQMRGEPITTASDIYSLGVILYELLTYHFPYQIKAKAMHEIVKVISEQEPTRPSTAITRVENHRRRRSQASQQRQAMPERGAPKSFGGD